MEVRFIEITKRVAVIATALSLLLQVSSPSAVDAKSHKLRSKAKNHRRIAQNVPTDNVGPAGLDESVLKFQDHDPEKPAPPPPAESHPQFGSPSQYVAPPQTVSPPRTPFATNQDVGLLNVLKNISLSLEKPAGLNLPENEQIVVGLARQILDQALRQLESSGQGVASGSANTKLWNSPSAKLSDRFSGSVAAMWRKTNEGMLTVTITGDCADNTVVDGKKIGEFIVSVEARSTVDLVDENKWIAKVSKVSVDADCCRGVAAAPEKKEETSKLSDQEKRKQEEEKKAKLPDSFFEYDKPGKERNIAPPVAAAPSQPTIDPNKDTTTVEANKDTTTVQAPPVVVPQQVNATEATAPPAATTSEQPSQSGVPSSTATTTTGEIPTGPAPAVRATASQAQMNADSPGASSSNPEDKILTSFRRNQYLDVRAFQEQQKSQPKQELPWTENGDNDRAAPKADGNKNSGKNSGQNSDKNSGKSSGKSSKKALDTDSDENDDRKENDSKESKSSKSKIKSKRLAGSEQPEIQNYFANQGESEDDDDKYGVKQAEKEAAEEAVAKKKAEKAERKKLKKERAADPEGHFIDKAIEKQEKAAEKEAAKADKESAKADKEKAKADKEKVEADEEAAREAAKDRKKAEKKKAKGAKPDQPKKTSIEDLFNQDLQVGDEFMDSKKVERMEKMSRAIAAKRGAKVSKETQRDKTDDLLAQALAEEQGTPVYSEDESKKSDEGIPDTFAAEKDTRTVSPRKLFDRLDPDEEITPAAPVEKKPEMTFQERIKRANRPEGADAVPATPQESTTSGAFSGPVSLRDPIAELGGSNSTIGSGSNAQPTGDPIAQLDETIAPQAVLPAQESAIEGWNRIRIPDVAATGAVGAGPLGAVDNTSDGLIASNSAKVRGKGGSIASRLFAEESAFSNNLLSSRPVLNSNIPSAISTLGTVFDGSSKSSSAKRPGLDAIIVMPDRAIAGDNITVAVLEKKNQPEHAIELNFNGAPLATDSNGQAQYHVPEDASPGKTLILSVTGRPELRCIDVIHPLAAPSSTRPSIDNISKLVVSGSVVTINGHNFSGIAADNKVTIDDKDAEVVAASPLQLKVALPTNLTPGTHSIGVKGDRDNHDSFDYVTTEVKLEPKRGQLIVKVNGTVRPVHIRLTNRTPELIQIDQGDNVLVTTSGGQYNTLSVTVRQVKKDFRVDAEIEL